MLKTVDKTATHTIQKQFLANGVVIGYQTIKTDNIGKEQAKHFDTLGEARDAVGKVLTPPVIETAPKDSYPQTQKGYKHPNK